MDAGTLRGVADVPRAQDGVVAAGAEVHRARAGDQRGELLVVAGVPRRAALVLGRGAVDDVAGRAAGEVAREQRVDRDGLARPGAAGDQATWVR